MTDRLRTILVGAGRVGAGYATDSRMARHFRYSTHAQVLAEHPSFDWVGAVDPAPSARDRLRSLWDVSAVGSIDELGDGHVDVAVLAVEPEARIDAVRRLEGLRGVLVEKPLGLTSTEAAEFLDLCDERGILVQVNLWRRADSLFRALANGELSVRIGVPQAVTAVYGNGLLNNGIHVVDFIRMLAGEVETVTVLARPEPSTGPIDGDVDVAFGATLTCGATVSCHPLSFRHYREVGFDVWGTAGRLSVLQEGLVILSSPRVPNRAVADDWEVASDAPVHVPSTVSDAFFHMYSNLAEALHGRAELWSSGENALRSTAVVDAVLESARVGASVRLR